MRDVGSQMRDVATQLYKERGAIIDSHLLKSCVVRCLPASQHSWRSLLLYDRVIQVIRKLSSII